jgi:hypothetical protein
MWRQQARTVAAYRDRYEIVDTRALGAAPRTETQRHDFAQARRALVAARRIAELNDSFAAQRPGRTTGLSPMRIRI